MMFQRNQPPPESFEATDALWSPELPADVTPSTADLYLAIDERVEGTMRLAVAAWPRLDRAGRLDFPRDYQPVFVTETALQTAVDAQRARLGQEASDRPVRIGDVFLVRSDGRRGRLPRNPASWPLIVDVSAAAREQAKIALYSAVAPFVEPDEPVLQPQTPEDRPRPGPSARPAV
jgi:hypothetical protein